MHRITLHRPDDWHLHLRDGAMLRAVLPESARHFARAIVMPSFLSSGKCAPSIGTPAASASTIA